MPVADPSNPQGMQPIPGLKRSRGEDPYPVPSHRWNAVPENFREISGWGVDLDPKDRPMVPKELPSSVETVRGRVEHWQPVTQKVLVSNEMPDMTPVYGTSSPPHGLSGRIREQAFEYSEGTARHWIGLIFADRVDMVESFFSALLHGRPDNIVTEKGWIARVSDNRTQKRNKIALAAVGAALFAYRFARTPRGRYLLSNLVAASSKGRVGNGMMAGARRMAAR